MKYEDESDKQEGFIFPLVWLPLTIIFIMMQTVVTITIYNQEIKFFRGLNVRVSSLNTKATCVYISVYDSQLPLICSACP